MLKRVVLIGLAVGLSPAIALAYPQDARSTTQFSVTPASDFVSPPNANGLPTSAATTIDSPGINNGANGPDGIVFCTLEGNNCLPISRASCLPSEKRLIEFTLTTVSQGTVPLNSIARVYPSANGDCSWPGNLPPKRKDGSEMPQDTSGPITTGNPIYNGNQAWKFPNNVDNAQLTTVNALANAILACDDTGINNTRYVFCIAFDQGTGGGNPDGIITAANDSWAQATFLVDTVSPDAPSTFVVTGGDGGLSLRIGQSTNSSEIFSYTIRYHVAPDTNVTPDPNDDCTTWTDAQESSQRRVGTTDDPVDLSVSGVPNGYIDVCAAGVDLAGNIGAFSSVERVVVHDECDFIQCYPGTPPTGYCGSIPPSMLLLWIVVPLLARRRFRKQALLVTPFVLAVLVPATAKAGLEPPGDIWITDSEGANSEKRPLFGVQLMGGPMKPEIGDADAQRVYDSVFDSKSLFKHKPMLLQLEVDWYLVNRFGLGGLYGRIGHWRASGHTRDCATGDDPTAACTPDTIVNSTQGASKTSLTILPLTVGVIYKFDQIKEHTWIPLVPYVKAGVDWYLWSNTVNGKASRASDGSKGHGGQFGINGTLGIALNMDWIDADAARNARNASRISDTYLFFQWTGQYGKIRSHSLDFSSSYFQAGVALDFL